MMCEMKNLDIKTVQLLQNEKQMEIATEINQLFEAVEHNDREKYFQQVELITKKSGKSRDEIIWSTTKGLYDAANILTGKSGDEL